MINSCSIPFQILTISIILIFFDNINNYKKETHLTEQNSI